MWQWGGPHDYICARSKREQNQGRQTVSAHWKTRCRTAMILKVSKQFRVLPMSIFCQIIVFPCSGESWCEVMRRCQSWPCTITSGMDGMRRVAAAASSLTSFWSRLKRALVQIASCGLPSVHDLSGAFVSMLTAIGVCLAVWLVVRFQLLTLAGARGCNRVYAFWIRSSGTNTMP